MFWPKAPLIDRPIVIYKGFVETGPGQFPIKKNVDWVEELGPVQAKMKYATKWGFLFGNVIAATDILVMHQIKERQAQIARYAFYTIPITSMFAGWMGGIEISKMLLGSDKYVEAHVMGSLLPGAIFAFWRSTGFPGFLRASLPWAYVGFMYAYAQKHDLYWSIWDGQKKDNPNIPTGFLARDWSTFGMVNKSEYGKTQFWWYPKDEGPSWKKWDDEEREKWDNREWKPVPGTGGLMERWEEKKKE